MKACVEELRGPGAEPDALLIGISIATTDANRVE
jgi:hypothetical protein